MRRALQVTIAILSLAPLMFGLTNLCLGAARFMPTDDITIAIDSQFRFQSGVYVSLALLLWWMIPRIERVTWPFRAVALGLFLGGVGRVISMQQFGTPEGNMFAGMILELAMPLFVLWQWLVARQAQASIAQPA